MSGRRPVDGAFAAYQAQKGAGGSRPATSRRPARPAPAAGARRAAARPTGATSSARPSAAAPRTGAPRSSRPPTGARRPRTTVPAAPTRGAQAASAELALVAAIGSVGRVLGGGQGRRQGGSAPSPAVVRRRLRLIPAISVLLAALVTAKLVDVQVRNPDRWVAQGETQRIASHTLPAGRGSLLDRNGNPFSLSIPLRSVFADPELIVDPQAAARDLAPLLGVDRLELVEQMSRDGRFVMLAHTLPDEDADAVEALDIAGIGTVEEFKRFRPNDTLARSLIGSVSVDGSQGISGLEEQYDEVLTGQPGEIAYEKAKVKGGGTIAGSARSITPARPGADVTLTLDQALQYETEQTLADHLAQAGAGGGIAIVSRPSTGEILALANLEVGEDGRYRPSSNNRALTTVFEPGSVNKVITIAAALEEGLVTPETVLQVPDSLDVGDHTFTDSHPHPTTAWSVTDILATSSNVGTIMLAQELGSARMDEYLRRFGFGTATGLGFPAESSGILLPAADWEAQSTAIGSIPIGQGISVTAVQMLQAYNVLANDGSYVPARLVRAISRPDGSAEPVPSADPVQVVSPSTAAAVRAMMAQVVSRGTGQSAAVPGYTVAGKTGTARKPQDNGTYEDENGAMHYIATFAGLLPAENPDLSVIVVVDEPDPDVSIYASDVAAPAFSDLALQALRRFQIPPSVGSGPAEVPTLSDSALEVEEARLPTSPGRTRDDEETATTEPGEETDGDGDGDGETGTDPPTEDDAGGDG